MHKWVLSVSVSAVLSLAAELLSVSTMNEKNSSSPGLDESSLVLLCFNDVVTNRKGKLEIEVKNDHFQNHSDKLHALMNCWNKIQFL